MLSRPIASGKFQVLLRFNSLQAHSFFVTKLMSNEQIFRISASILAFQPLVKNTPNLI